jgi:hypothetical protein
MDPACQMGAHLLFAGLMDQCLPSLPGEVLVDPDLSEGVGVQRQGLLSVDSDLLHKQSVPLKKKMSLHTLRC